MGIICFSFNQQHLDKYLITNIQKVQNKKRHMTQLNQQYLNEQNSAHTQVRQNLINDPSAQQQIPMQQIIAPPLVHPPLQYNAMLNIPQQQANIPLVPISKYKWPLEIWLFFGGWIEILWFGYGFVHFLWVAWYMMIGFWRHGNVKRKVRFWGEFMNLMIWIVTNCYVFSGNRGAIFPFVIILENMDYYFIGGHLANIYLSYFSYSIRQSYADFRLYIIIKKLQQRRKIFVQTQLQKFIQNEKQHTTQLRQIIIGTQQSVGQNMIRDYNQVKQRDQNQVKQRDQNQVKQRELNKDNNSCMICLSQFGGYEGMLHMQTVRLYCDHRFHYSCLKDWIDLGNEQCPTCRRNLIQ